MPAADSHTAITKLITFTPANIGAFAPTMAELSRELCQHIANRGTVYVDTHDAKHEAGDLLQAGWDLAAARLALRCS